jgi:Ni/Fe-hydrogenase subunit HybB-like protein
MIVLSYLPGEPAFAYASYFPSLVEFVSGAGVVAFGLLAFSLGVRYLRVVDHKHDKAHEEAPAVQPVPVPVGD